MKNRMLFIFLLVITIITAACGGGDSYQRDVNNISACFGDAFEDLHDFFPGGQVSGPLPASDQFVPIMEQYQKCFAQVNQLETPETYPDVHKDVLEARDEMFTGANGLVFWLSRNNNSDALLEKIQSAVDQMEEGHEAFLDAAEQLGE